MDQYLSAMTVDTWFIDSDDVIASSYLDRGDGTATNAYAAA